MIVSGQPARPSSYSCRRDGLWEVLLAELSAAETPQQVAAIRAREQDQLPVAWVGPFHDACDDTETALRHRELDAAFRGAIG